MLIEITALKGSRLSAQRLVCPSSSSFPAAWRDISYDASSRPGLTEANTKSPGYPLANSFQSHRRSLHHPAGVVEHPSPHRAVKSSTMKPVPPPSSPAVSTTSSSSQMRECTMFPWARNFCSSCSIPHPALSAPRWSFWRRQGPHHHHPGAAASPLLREPVASLQHALSVQTTHRLSRGLCLRDIGQKTAIFLHFLFLPDGVKRPLGIPG